MKTLIKFFSIILIVSICCTTPTSFFASTYENYENSNTITLTSDMMNEADIAFCNLIMGSDLNDGDVIVLEKSPFESLYITVEDNSTNIPRFTYLSTTRTITFTRSILGIQQKLFKVTLTCDWIKDGENSKIKKFQGQYETLALGVTCSWDKNYCKYGSLISTLCLDFTYDFGLKSSFVFLSASISPDYNSLSISSY